MSTPSDSEEDILHNEKLTKWSPRQSQSISASQTPPTSSAPPSTGGNGQESAARPSGTVPIQKRRRVTRACDECRRKKIKCDGKQPCTHCTVYSYDCTYDQPSNRRRNPTPQYIEAIETRLHRMEALFKVILPNVDINTLNLEGATQLQKLVSDNSERNAKSSQGTEDTNGSTEALLESMIEAAGKLDIDESGHLDFHGHSSGLTFLNKLREQFGDLLGKSTNSLLRFNILPNAPTPQSIPSGSMDFVKSPINSPREANVFDNITLPKKVTAEELVNACLNEACILFRFIHRPSFDAMFERIYKKDPELYDNEEYRFLPLLYLSLAVGCVFTFDSERLGFKNGTDEGIKYFQAGRRMIDITDCRDCTSIQCVLLMILFLQSSAKMSTCYSYVAIALSASLRMGLHRKISFPDPVESEVRKRIFWTIRKLGIYVGTLLGLPKGIQDEDIDQELPLEIDDHYITANGIIGLPGKEPSSLAAANAHTKLLKILDKLVRKIYPIKGMQISNTGRNDTYMVSYASVREIEDDLANWHRELPPYLWLGKDDSPRFKRSRYLLRVSYAHVKMLLYRPFLHYVAKSRNSQIHDARPYSSAAECIKTSREIIRLCVEMKEQNILNGAYWFNIYTTFFSVLSLLYFVLENMSDSTAPEILRDATLGKDCLLSLQDQSIAAERCCASLKTLFDQLPTKLEAINKNTLNDNKKKRSRGISPSPEILNVQMQEDASFEDKRDLDNDSSFQKFLPQYEVHTQPVSSSDISYQQHLGGTTGLPDLNSLMFPASSAFAYGSQAMKLDPLIQLPDNVQDTLSTSGMSMNTPNSRYGTSSGLTLSADPSYDILEAQFAGPLPAYTYRGQSNANQLSDSTMQVNGDMSFQSGALSFMPYSTNERIQLNSFPVDLDDIFGHGLEETQWDDLLSQNVRRQ